MPDWNTLLFAAPPGPDTTPRRVTGWEHGLDPTLAAKARQLQDLAAQEGISLRITTGYRSPQEQERLYAQGRTTPGPIVTNAKPGQSRHQHGTAIDVVPLKDGQPDWRSPHWGRLGELGQSLGLEWGGTWKRLTDRPHFQLSTATPSRQAAHPSAPAAPREWAAVLFGAPPRATSAPAATPDRSAVVQRIRQEAQRHGVDPQLAVAVATQESSLDPGKVGDNGKSLGLFQLQEAAAIDAGIEPRRRGDLAENIRGGVRYLKLQLDREGGNVERALSRYNRGTPTYQGRGDPDYVAHVMQYYPGQGARVAAVSQAPPAPRDWGQELFAPSAPVPAVANAVPATGPDHRTRDWGQALFATPAASAPSSLYASEDLTAAWFPDLG